MTRPIGSRIATLFVHCDTVARLTLASRAANELGLVPLSDALRYEAMARRAAGYPIVQEMYRTMRAAALSATENP